MAVVHCEPWALGATTHAKNPRINWSKDEAGFKNVATLWEQYVSRFSGTGVRFCFMASEAWWSACARWAPDWAKKMVAAGHYMGLHERGGYTSYAKALTALEKLGVKSQFQIASGVLSTEAAGFPAGWAFTGMAWASGHEAGSNLASLHISGIWGFDDAAKWEGPGTRYTLIGYGSGSTSKLSRMCEDMDRLGGIQTYVEDQPSVVVSYAVHGIMLDAQGLVDSAFGISPPDTPDAVEAVLKAAASTEGVKFETFESLLSAWEGPSASWSFRTAGRDAGENHWSGIGGGVF